MSLGSKGYDYAQALQRLVKRGVLQLAASPDTTTTEVDRTLVFKATTPRPIAVPRPVQPMRAADPLMGINPYIYTHSCKIMFQNWGRYTYKVGFELKV